MNFTYIIIDYDESCGIGPFTSRKQAQEYIKEYLVISSCKVVRLKNQETYRHKNKRERSDTSAHEASMKFFDPLGNYILDSLSGGGYQPTQCGLLHFGDWCSSPLGVFSRGYL